MKNFKVCLLLCGICLFTNGCSSVVNKNTTEESSETLVENTEDNMQVENDKQDDTETDSLSADDLYSEFLEGKGKLNFDYYMTNIFKGTDHQTYVDDVIGYVPADGSYTVSELTDKLNEILHSEEDGFYADTDISSIEYAYIDCGKDGTKELVLSLGGPFVEPESHLTLIIKDMDNKLEVVYAYATWSRSYTTINDYGFISGDGSNGASNHGWNAAYIDADGKYLYGYYEELEYDFASFALTKDHDEYDLSQLEGNILTYSLRLEEYSEDAPNPDYYTFEVTTKDTYEEMDVPDLYTNSPYKDVVDSVHGCKFVTMDEYNQIKDDKIKSIGVTDEIMNGSEPEYKALSMVD